MLTKLNHNNRNLKKYSSIFLIILLTYIQILFPTLSSYFIISSTFSNNVYASSSIIIPDNSINISNINSNTHIDKTLNAIIAGNSTTEVNLMTGNDKAEYNNQKGFILTINNNKTITNNTEQDNNNNSNNNNNNNNNDDDNH